MLIYLVQPLLLEWWNVLISWITSTVYDYLSKTWQYSLNVLVDSLSLCQHNDSAKSPSLNTFICIVYSANREPTKGNRIGRKIASIQSYFIDM